MKQINYYWQLLSKKILVLLGVRSYSGGLEVTDQALRLVRFDSAWREYALRLVPETLIKGRIKDRERFLEALMALKTEAFGPSVKNKKIDITLAIGEETTYNQVVALPLVKGKALLSAIELNMQMASPTELSQVYSGWEVVGRDEKASRIEVMASFADRAMIDEVVAALFEVGFVPLAVESKALALARMVRGQKSLNPDASYLLVNVDDTGLTFLVIRKGRLYFEYATPWRDLADEKGTVPFEKFGEAFAVGLRRVMNFYLQHWSDAITSVLLASATFQDELQKIVQETLALPVLSVVMDFDPALSSEWFPALGAALRGPGDESAITFLGEGAKNIFFRDRIIRFVQFWRLVIPISLAILLVLFGIADFFLLGVKTSIAPYQATEGNSITGITAGLAQLTTEASTFNRSVALIGSIESTASPSYTVLQGITGAAAGSGVTLTKVVFPGENSQPIAVNGESQSEPEILAFQSALEANGFSNVVLPLTAIQNVGSMYSFSMTFEATSTP